MASKPAKPVPTIIRDTREKVGHGWSFAKSSTCAGTERTCLKTGDYTIKGLEDKICIDRKESINEFANNLVQPRFVRELERMAAIEHCYVILQFEYDDLLNWPASGHLPRSKERFIKMDGRALQARFWDLALRFPRVHFHFAGVHGREAARSFLKRAWVTYGRSPRKTD